MDWSVVVHSAAFKGALSGFVAAASVDIHAWLTSTTWYVEGFNWGLATKRWATGVVSGALAGSGYGALVG